MAFNITAIMNVALASGAATKISRDINKALQNKRVTVDLSLANPDSIKRIKADIEGAITSVESFGRQAGLAAKRFGAFSLAAGSMITLVGAIKSSTAEAISFDREMVRLGQVSNDSVASIQAVGNEVTRLSVALGVSSKDLIGAAVTLKQANLSIDDTKIALEALAKAALAPNFENFANTTQGAIAVLNQFKIGAAGLEAALGSVNAVAGEYAVEASDLVEVIRKTGGAFKSAGGDLNELLALFTSVRQTTRESAETISTGLRTIFTRIQRGQTIESLKELGINLRYTSQEAAALGNIKLADQFVGPYEAVRRLSEALAGIPTTSGKYSAIVEELGGYRQISKVIPLLQEFSVSQGALNVALGGSSSLAANAAQAQNAYIIKIQKIKEEFNALIRSVTQSSGFQKIFDTFISGASAAIQLADALKFLLPLITAIAAVKLATSFGQFVKGFATGVTASPNPKIFNQNRVAEGGYIKMAKGGVVPGSGSGDKVKALLEPGELVIPKKYAVGGPVPVNDMPSLAIQRKLNDPKIEESEYKSGKTINKKDRFKYEIVTINIDGGPNSTTGNYIEQGQKFEIEAARQLKARWISKDKPDAPVDLEKNGFPYEVKNVSSPVRNTDIVDKLARYRLESFGDRYFTNSSGVEDIDLGQIGLVYNTQKIKANEKAFEGIQGKEANEENERTKSYASLAKDGTRTFQNLNIRKARKLDKLNKSNRTTAASGGFMIPGTGNTDSVPMDLDEGSFVVRKSSVAKLGAENLSSISRQGYAKGGKVPALLMPGEFVFSPSSAKSIGSANLERMNKHAKFAAGGRVGLAEGGNPNPIGEEAYSVASQTKIKIPNFQKIQEFANSFPDLTAAQESLRKIILEEVNAFSVNLSEAEKLAEASRIATDIMRRYEDIDKAIKAQQDVIDNRSSTATQPEIDADAAELRFLKRQRGKLTKEVGLSSTVLPTGDAEFRTKIGSEPKPEIGKGKEYDYAINEKRNISDEIRNRARDRAVKISPSGDGENIASVTKTRLAAEEESKLRKELVLAIGEQLRITTGITDKEVLSEMAVEKFTLAMQQNAKIAKDSEGRLLGLVSLEQDIVNSGIKVDQSMRGVSQELKVGSTAIGKLKLVFRNAEDIVNRSFAEFGEEVRKGGGGISGFFSGVKNSKLGRIVAGGGAAIAGIGGQYLASTAGTAEDVSKGSVSEGRYVASTGIGEFINQGSTAAIALSMIPVAGPFLAVIGGATAGFIGLISAVKKAQIELMKVEVDKKAKTTSEKISELKNFSGVEREQKGQAAFADLRSTVFAIRQTATSEGLSGAKLEDEVRAKSLEKFGSNLGAISEELSNAIANMVKPDDKRKSEDIYNEFKQTSYGQLAIESLGIASGKSTAEVQKHALALASSAITAKKLEDAQKNSIVIHEKMNLRMSVLTNSINLASESFRNISESMVNFSDILEGRSEFKIQQNTSRLKIGTDKGLFDKETDRAFLPFGKEGDNLKNQAKELNLFALNLPAAFDTAKETVRNNKTGDIGVTTEEILKKQLGMKQEDRFTSTQQDLIDLFKGQIQNEQKNKPDLGGISGEKITKDALGQAISQMEQLLQSNMQSVNQVSQQYISGLRRISDEQKKYIQELDRVAEKTLSVNKAQANIDAAKVRGNPEDFLTREQRIAPFVQKQINVTQGAVNRGAIQAKDIQDPQAIFKAITDAQAALIDSDKKLQEENAKLASANKGDAEAARKAALENNNLRDNISTLGEALRNLRDDTVMLAEAESRLTQAEKDRENKLSVTENLLTMDKAGKRSLQRGKDAAEQVAGGANLEDMSLKQRKAFFEYTKLYANIKVPGLGGKTGEQVRQVGLERAAGGLELGVGKENEAANKAREDILKIEKTREEAAKKYADLLKGNDQANVDALKKVGDNFITELQNMLARENDRNLKGQIAVEDVKMDKLTQIKDDKNYQQYTNIIGQGANKDNREKQFSTVFDSKNLKNIADKKKEIEIVQSRMDAVDRYTKDEGSRVNLKQKDFDKKIVLNKELNSMKGPFTDEDLKSYLPSVVASPFQLAQGAKDTPAGEFATKTPDLLLIAERMRGVGTSIEKLPKAIDDLALIIKDMKGRLINPPADNKANGGFIGRSMGGSIYNNPTKDIAQRDQYPTYLSEGEFVVNKEGARNNRSELELMNKGHKVGYFDVGGRLTQADIDKSRRETLEERARIANNRASMTGSSVKKTEGVQGEGISEGTYLAQKRFDGLDYNEESGIAKKVNIFKDVPETRSIRTQYSSYPYKDRDGIFNRKDFIDTFGEKNADYSNDAEDIAWEAFKKFESNTNQPKKFPRTFIPVSERVNPISAEDIDLMMKPSSPKSIQDKKDLLLANIKKMEESKEYKEKELDVKEKYNLTDLKMPEGFKFEGYEKHLDAIRPNRKTEKKGRKDEDITDINDVKYTIADIRFEFERAVSDLAYVNAESRKLSKNENIAEDVVGRLTYSKDTWQDISNPAASLRQIKEDANKFDYEDEFFHELKRVTPRYPFSYGNEIDPSVSNDIKTKGVGLRDAWLEIGGSYGPVENPILGKFEAMSIENQIKLRQEQEDENDRNKKRKFITLPQQNLLEENFQNREVEGRLYNPRDKEFKSPIGGQELTLPQDSANNLSRSLNANEFAHTARMGGLKLRGMPNQQESDILIDLIKQAREQKKQALAQNIENIKKKVNAQIEAESSLTKGIPLKGVDAKLAKTNENLYARIANPRLTDDKLPFPVQGFRGEFTPKAEKDDVFRPTIAMQEARAKKNEIFNAGAGERQENRQFQAANLNFKMKEEAERHSDEGDVLRGTSSLYNEENESFGGPFKNLPGFYEKGPQNELQRVTAYKKNQIQSGKTDPLAQRLHTQIAKTIASYKEPKMDFNHPEVYERYLKQVDISKLGDVKKLSSVSLKAYADENIPILNPAIMALQEYYDSVNERRFGFNNTEDFARTIQNKNIELAAKMDREAAMLLARKVRGEVKVEDSSSEVSPIGDGPRKDAARLTNIYRDYHHSLGKKWLGTPLSPDNLNNPLEFTNGMSGFEPHDNDEKDKNYQDAYDRSRSIIKDLVNIDSKKSSLGYARPYYEKVKQEQAALENFIKSKIDYKKLGIRAFMDLRKDDPQEHTDKQIKEDRSEKRWREIQALPFTDNPIGKIKNQSGQVINVPKNRAEAAKVIAEEQAKPVGQAKPPVIPMPAQELSPVVAMDQTKPKISPEEMMNKLFNEGPKEGKAVLDFNQNGIRIQGSPEQEKEYATVQTYLNSPTYKAMKILQDKIDNIKLKQSLDTVQDSTAYPENAELSDTIYLRWLNEQVSTLKSQDIISEPYKEYAKLVTEKIGEKFIDFKSSGGPVAYRSGGGNVVRTMLTPGEKVFYPNEVARIESKNPGILSAINSGQNVKNFSFGGSVNNGSFTVPAYAPNPEGVPSQGTDTVYKELPEKSFVINKTDTNNNRSLLQNLASGGAVGYYGDGDIVNPAANYFSSIGKKPQEKNNGFDVNSFVQKAVEEQKAKEEQELKNRIAEKQKELVDNKQKVMALNKNRANQTLTDEDAEFLKKDDESNSGALHKFDYMLAGVGVGKALFNGVISLGHHTIKQASKHVGKESAIEGASILAMMGFEKSTHAAVNSLARDTNKKEGESLSSLTNPKFDYDKKQKKGPSYASAYANGGVVGYYQNAGPVKRPKTISEIRQEEKEAREKETKKIIDRSYDEGGQGIIGGIRENEKNIFLGDRNWIKKNNNELPLDQQRVASLSLTSLQEEIINKLTDKQLKENLTPLEADKLQRAKQEFANRIKKIRYNEGYTQLNNALNSQKRGGKKDNTEAAERFEDFLKNNKIKGKAYDGLPNALKGKNIDKSYLTGIAHFEPKILNKLNDEKIKNIAINLIKERKIKGFSGDSGKFEEANYFGELGDKFNTKDVFLKMSDIRPVIDLLNRVDKGRETNLNSTAQGKRIKSKNPLNAEKFMREYGNIENDILTHTALTAQAMNINQEIKPKGNLNLMRQGNPLLEGAELEEIVNTQIFIDGEQLSVKPKNFNLGGYVNGASDGDSVNAKLRPGEFVLTPRTAQKLGYGRLKKANQGFYNGGEVGDSGGSVFDKMNNVANSQSANSIDVDSLNNAAREFNKAAKSFETSMAKMEKSAKTLEGAMDKLSKVNIPENITGNITVNNQATVTIDSPNFAKDMTTTVGKYVSDLTARLKDATDGKIDIA